MRFAEVPLFEGISFAVSVRMSSKGLISAAEPEEVGFLQTGKPGFYVHHALCVTGDGRALPLGVPWSQLWGRPQRSRNLGRNRTGSELAKLKERESDRWLEGITEAALWTEGCREVVHVMDREADSARVFGLLADLSSDFVIRNSWTSKSAGRPR